MTKMKYCYADLQVVGEVKVTALLNGQHIVHAPFTMVKQGREIVSYVDYLMMDGCTVYKKNI